MNKESEKQRRLKKKKKKENVSLRESYPEE